jgi:hypothetical protein
VPGGTQLWLVLLVGMGVLFVLVARRMSQLIARTRDLERYQRTAARLDERFAAAAGPVVAQLDELRRRSGDPQALAAILAGAADSLRSVAVDARALRGPHGLAHLSAGLVREMDRAVRAMELVEHGLGAILVGRGSRELEAQTSLKRGALNLRHAGQVVRQLLLEIESIRPGDLANPGSGRSSAVFPPVPAYLADAGDDDLEEPFDARM